MNDRTETLLKNFKPKLAIVVFTSMVSGNANAYLESHEINDAGQLLEGKPLKQETIEGIVDVFFDERQNRVQIGGIIPFNLIKFDILPGGNYEMIWHRPAEKRCIYFSKALHIPSGEAWVPAMLYKASSKYLSVFALNKDERPKGNTKLYHAPFHNVDSTGSVCLGSAKVKKPGQQTYQAFMQYWEDMFWLSEFSHLAHASNPTKSNLNMLWKKLIGNSKLTWAGFDELVVLKNLKTQKHKTLEALL